MEEGKDVFSMQLLAGPEDIFSINAFSSPQFSCSYTFLNPIQYDLLLNPISYPYSPKLPTFLPSF